MANMTIYDKFRSVPQEAQKTIGGGRLKGMTDINPMWRIKVLTEQFGPCGVGWYTDNIVESTEQGANGEMAVIVTLSLLVKIDGEWSKPIYGTGGSLLIAKESSGLRTDDDAFKKAYTDALSVACKSLGIGADVYFDKDKTKYDTTDRTPPGTAAKTLIKKIADVVAADPNLRPLVDQHEAAYGAEKITDLSVEHLESLYRLLTEA